MKRARDGPEHEGKATRVPGPCKRHAIDYSFRSFLSHSSCLYMSLKKPLLLLLNYKAHTSDSGQNWQKNTKSGKYKIIRAYRKGVPQFGLTSLSPLN